MFGKDPEHEHAREIIVADTQMWTTGECEPGTAKGLLQCAYCMIFGDGDENFELTLDVLLEWKDTLCLLTAAINKYKVLPDGEKKTELKKIVVSGLCAIGMTIPIRGVHGEEVVLNYLRKIKSLAEQMMA
jgi:hypothetical protein